MTFIKNFVWLMLALILVPIAFSMIMFAAVLFQTSAGLHHDDGVPTIDMSAAYRTAAKSDRPARRP